MPPSAATIKKRAHEVLSTLSRVYRKPKLLSQAPLLERLIYAIAQQATSGTKAEALLKAMTTHFVDWNEVRVCHVTEVQKLVEECDIPNPAQLSQTLLDFLGSVHLARNHLELEFLLELPHEEQREFLLNLTGVDASVAHYFLLCQFEEDKAVLSQTDLARVMQRIGLMEKSSSAKKVISALESLELGAELVAFQNCLIRLGNELCGSRSYDCANCKIQKQCETGKKKGKK